MRRTLLALLVASAATAQVPTPESVFGHKVGADFKLIDYDESIRYFQQLAAKSDRIRLLEVGKTSTGLVILQATEQKNLPLCTVYIVLSPLSWWIDGTPSPSHTLCEVKYGH